MFSRKYTKSLIACWVLSHWNPSHTDRLPTGWAELSTEDAGWLAGSTCTYVVWRNGCSFHSCVTRIEDLFWNIALPALALKNSRKAGHNVPFRSSTYSVRWREISGPAFFRGTEKLLCNHSSSSYGRKRGLRDFRSLSPEALKNIFFKSWIWNMIDPSQFLIIVS